MSLTLLEAKKTERDALRYSLISELSVGEFLGIIPFTNVPNGVFPYNKETELPGVGFRGINESYDQSVGVINPEFEQVKPMGSDIDVDNYILDTQGEEPKSMQILMKMRAMRGKAEDQFINGDETVDPRGFDGLRRRITLGSSQAISMGGALTLTALDELIDSVDAPGGDKYLLMNRAMRRRLTAASRDTSRSGFIMHDLDRFGRKVQMYGDIPILALDVNGQNQQILGFTETAGGAATGGSSTSIYCVALGDGLMTGLQGPIKGNFGPSIEPLGRVHDAPVDRTTIEWYIGMAIQNGRAASRLYGVTNAVIA